MHCESVCRLRLCLKRSPKPFVSQNSVPSASRRQRRMPNQPKGAIVGLGVTPMGKIYGRRSVDFAAEAIVQALDDAGLVKSDVDGLLINANISGDMDVRTQMTLGFENLTLVNVMSAY